MYYTCLGCNRHVLYDGQDGVQCGQCDIWLHRKSVGLTKQQFRYLQNNTNDSWYCRNCTKDMLPFYDLGNNQICNMYNERKKQKIFRIEIIAKNERKTDFCFA